MAHGNDAIMATTESAYHRFDSANGADGPVESGFHSSKSIAVPTKSMIDKTLMPHGPDALFRDTADKLRKSLDHALPQMDVRFAHLSVSVDVPIAVDNDATAAAYELPTLVNAVKQSVRALSAKKHAEKRYILKDISGVFQPGTMTLVLGQPGSGKSTLLKALSGRLPVGSNGVAVEGEILYNNQHADKIRMKLPQLAGYVPQRDVHFASLTVQETLEFAHRCSTDGLARSLDSSLNKSTVQQDNTAAQHAATALLSTLPDLVLELLGLQSCKDTVVGDAMLRGISGGEKKRVTTGEMLFGTKLALFMDDISTGLDSAATFDIVSAMQSVARAFGTTIVMSLLQPSPEVFALFDDVLVLNEGEMLYHGPQTRVMAYFDELGFVCPPERDSADFLLDMGTPAQARYQVAQRPSSGLAAPQTPDEFSRLLKRSSITHGSLGALEAPHDSERFRIAQAFIDATPEFRQSFWAGTSHVLKRELTIASRNSAFIKGRAFMIVLMGLLYSNMFYQFDPARAQVVMGITYSASLFISLGQVSQVPVIMAARDMFYKQRRANFLRASSLVISNAISRVPVALVETLVFGTAIYWMCGYSPNAASFVAFEILFCLTGLAMGSWFYLLSVTVSSTAVAIPLGLLSTIVNAMFSGFFVPKAQIPDYLIWLYWLTPMSWCVRGIAVNQYQSPEFTACTYANVNYCDRFGVKTSGEYLLSLYGVPSETAWIYGGMLFMVAFTAVMLVASTLALEYRRFESPPTQVVVKKTEAGLRKSELSSVLATSQARSQTGAVALDVQQTSRAKHFVPVTLAFQDLWYTVPLKAKTRDDPTSIDLLKGVSGYAAPGTMTALMGASGAGKTTLMDVIAARKTGGTIRGRILVNGYEATDTVIRRGTSYCEQIDVHSEASTFREALTFSAFLRQSSDVPDSFKRESVDECLDLLDLHAIANKLIRGSSMEQMKRLTIGVELAAQPSVLFLDEPTSGLDAQAAKSIMDGVRKVADSGRTVMCTIHQPSAEVFDVFDNLLLLKKGGETVYFGEIGQDKRTLIDYFEHIPGVARLEQGYNPATWILECIGAGVSSSASVSSVDFAEVFAKSSSKQVMEHFLDQDGVTRPSPSVPELSFANKRAASQWTQMTFLVGRALRDYWRSPSYNLTRLLVAFGNAAMFAVVFAGAKYETYQEVNGGMGMIFLSTVFCGAVAFFSTIPVAFAERASFYRERASQTYSTLWYFLGISIAEIPYVFASGLVFTLVFYPSVGFKGFTTGVLYWINKALLILMQTYTGQLLVFALPSEELAFLLSVLINTAFFLFMGFNPPAFAIPSGFKWLYYATPKRYSFSILSALVFTDCPDDAAEADRRDFIGCQPLVGAPPNMQYASVKEYIEDVFGAKHDEIWSNFGIVLLSIIVIRVLGLLALRFINHQKR